MDLLDMYVDGKDSVNNWCMAKIIEYDLETHRLTLHFDGWSTRYDEVSKLTNNYMKHTVQIVRINSTRIAPFRKYTWGYTGQRNKALREFDLNYAYQVTLLNKIDLIIQSEFKCFDDGT